MKIRSRTIAYASERKKKAAEKENNLNQEIQNLENREPKTDDDINNLKEKKTRVSVSQRTKDSRSHVTFKSKMD